MRSCGAAKVNSISGPSDFGARAAPSLSGSRESVRRRMMASIKLVFPLPFGPITRLKGVRTTRVFRNALKFRNAMDAITSARCESPLALAMPDVFLAASLEDHSP